MPELVKQNVSGYEVYRSPEFQALCRRFGVVLGLRTKEITLKLTEDEFLVTQTYLTEEQENPAVKAQKSREAWSQALQINLDHLQEEKLPVVHISPDKPLIVDNTSMSNDKWRTAKPARGEGHLQ